MLTEICGDIGSGKTALATYFAVMRMLYEQAIIDVMRLRQYVRNANKLGKRLTAVKDHLVYADYNIRVHPEFSRPLERKAVDGWRIGLVNEYGWETHNIPPYSLIVLDEAQKYYDSRRYTASNQLPSFILNYYAMHRHYFLDIIHTCQRPVSIDKAVRGLAQRFIFPRVRYENGKTIWDCIEFNNTDSAETYSDKKINTGDGKKTRYVYNGNIFDCYSSYGCHDYFTHGRTHEDFYYGNNIMPELEIPDVFVKSKRDKMDRYSIIDLEDRYIA